MSRIRCGQTYGYTDGRNNGQSATICSPIWEHNKHNNNNKNKSLFIVDGIFNSTTINFQYGPLIKAFSQNIINTTHLTYKNKQNNNKIVREKGTGHE